MSHLASGLRCGRQDFKVPSAQRVGRGMPKHFQVRDFVDL